MRPLILLGIAVVLCASACGQRPADSAVVPGAPITVVAEPATPTESPVPLDLPGRAVVTPDIDPAVWNSFPVDRRPRPIVLLAQPPVVPGFTTDEAKQAALTGNFELAAALPTDVPPVITATLPDGPAEFRTLDAKQAFDNLLAAFPREVPGDALPITRVELGSASFQSDRGPLDLPAWLFHAADALGPIAVPALPADAFWRQPTLPGSTPPARLAVDGTLTFSLTAAPEPCPGGEIYRMAAAVTETPTTVTVHPRSIPAGSAPGTPRGECGQRAVLKFEKHQVELAAPLGNRVLLDVSGAPVAVTG